ncbi:hypothetical protein H7J88_15320 [Mycolicibacterium flavescens]|uniref:Integral membrane protein n=1 Tax=Mycolicibacterium flavescens TaxID=1776 RepID=A0A1E3RKD1_MYCFV|nr:hypothetical protein [Mycolicibacterium flavescens]MCV7281012.1 hypothetical protein [Mycolicibacterium flavescens]ODQ90314.1 hypothetical protein BHQ18_09610 [Mycolicibacterium flavescens]
MPEDHPWAPDSAHRQAADRWFLAHGLPAVLRPGRLVRRLWTRSAPALAGFAVLMANTVVVVLITGKHAIDIDGQPTRGEWFVLLLLALVLPATGAVGWRVSRIASPRGRGAAAAAGVLVAVLGAVFGGPSSYVYTNLLIVAAAVAIMLALTATGIGSILGWAAHITLAHLAEAGSLLLRALPVLLLTFLVFFNSPVWLMAATVSRPRLWLALCFLGAIAAAFVVSVTIDRTRPMVDAAAPDARHLARLDGTPFAAMPDPAEIKPLRRVERVNVYFVLGVSQLAQILVVAVVTALLFFVLGLILLSPELLAAWTRNGPSDGQFLGMTIPVPEALIQVTLFLGALTFMYVSARAVGDDTYRDHFTTPLIEDLRVTLSARNRYREAVPAR